MNLKNVKVKVRMLIQVEEMRDKSSTTSRPGTNKASQRLEKVDIPVLILPYDDWVQRRADAIEALQFGNDLDADVPQSVVTNDASGVTHTIADLSGHLWNPEAVECTVTFEYGKTPALGSSAGAAESPSSAEGPTEMTATLAGLDANIQYYFRIKAVSAIKTVYGLIKSFKTHVAPV